MDSHEFAALVKRQWISGKIAVGLSCKLSKALLVGVILSVSHPLSSQPQIQLGLQAGVTYVSQSPSYATYPIGIEKGFRFGFLAGGLIEIGLSEAWFVQAEPRYNQKGWKSAEEFLPTLNAPAPISTTHLFLMLDYVELPLMIKAKLGDGAIKPFLCAGPSVGILVSAKYETIEFGSADQQGLITLDVKDLYQPIDISLEVSAGLEYQISTDLSLLACIGYSQGLTDLNKNSDASSDPLRSYGLHLVIGVLLAI